MRTITAGLFSAADGVVAEPQDWHFPYFKSGTLHVVYGPGPQDEQRAQ